MLGVMKLHSMMQNCASFSWPRETSSPISSVQLSHVSHHALLFALLF
jgi:hypothetical protein